MAKYTLGTLTEAIIRTTALRINSQGIPPCFSPSVIAILAELLENEADLFGIELAAQSYSSVCFLTAGREGLVRACDYYNRYFISVLEKKEWYFQRLDLVFPVLREYLLSLNNLNQNEEALKMQSFWKRL